MTSRSHAEPLSYGSRVETDTLRSLSGCGWTRTGKDRRDLVMGREGVGWSCAGEVFCGRVCGMYECGKGVRLVIINTNRCLSIAGRESFATNCIPLSLVSLTHIYELCKYPHLSTKFALYNMTCPNQLLAERNYDRNDTRVSFANYACICSELTDVKCRYSTWKRKRKRGGGLGEWRKWSETDRPTPHHKG